MEIEIKARVNDVTKLLEAITKIGGEFQTKKVEKDIYFRKNESQRQNEYIRLRVKKDMKIFGYHRYSKGATEELEFEAVGEEKTILNVFSKIGLRKIGVITKRRLTYKYKDFKICIDDLEEYGRFIEIETEGTKKEAAAKKRQCVKVLEELGLSKSDLSDEWYCNLVNRTNKLKV